MKALSASVSLDLRMAASAVLSNALKRTFSLGLNLGILGSSKLSDSILTSEVSCPLRDPLQRLISCFTWEDGGTKNLADRFSFSVEPVLCFVDVSNKSLARRKGLFPRLLFSHTSDSKYVHSHGSLPHWGNSIFRLFALKLNGQLSLKHSTA